MKFDIQLRRGGTTSNHGLELRVADEAAARTNGKLDFTLDAPPKSVAANDRAGRAGVADWVEITPGVYSMLIGNRSYEARVTSRPGASPRDFLYAVGFGSREYEVEIRDSRAWRRHGSSAAGEGPQEITAPMPGKIVKVLVTEGQQVSRGQGLMVIEAMKMQNELRAPRAGKVERVYAAEGSGVEAGAKLVRLDVLN